MPQDRSVSEQAYILPCGLRTRQQGSCSWERATGVALANPRRGQTPTTAGWLPTVHVSGEVHSAPREAPHAEREDYTFPYTCSYLDGRRWGQIAGCSALLSPLFPASFRLACALLPARFSTVSGLFSGRLGSRDALSSRFSGPAKCDTVSHLPGFEPDPGGSRAGPSGAYAPRTLFIRTGSLGGVQGTIDARRGVWVLSEV